jgi:fructokinase
MVRDPVRRATHKLMNMAEDKGVKMCFDPNLRFHLWKDHDLLKEFTTVAAARSTIVKLNQDELAFITNEKSIEKGAQKLKDLGAVVVVVTLGPKGAYYLCPNGEGKVDGFSVKVADTIGAGDGFIAGLLAGLAGGPWPPDVAQLEDAVRFANAVGAIVTTHVGAQSSLPRRPEVEAFLEKSLPEKENK